MSYLDDLTEGDVQEFFTKYGDDTVAIHDLGYGCDTELSVEELYQMFKARLKFEENSN